MKKLARTWWGRKFIEGLESFTEAGRLARGRHYATGRRVSCWTLRGNLAEAEVRGQFNPYGGIHEEPVYQTRIEFAPIPDAAWNEAIRHIGEKAGLVSRLLFNEMPDEIETPLAAVGVSLLPRYRTELRAECSCPDSETPCEHIAGLYGLVAGRLDQDPFLLFELRGLPRAELVRRLKATPLGAALATALSGKEAALVPAESYFSRPVPLALPETVSARDFWRGARRLPAGVEIPPPAAVSGILVRKGGDYPPFWDKNLSFIEVMDAFYEQVRKKAPM